MNVQRDIESQMRRYILGDGSTPDALIGRFRPGWIEDVLAVHRNNFRLNLVQVLAANFPAVANLIGEDCFAATAGLFVTNHPPVSPVLSEYGAAFPRFLDHCHTVSSVPYLGDVACLDWAWNGALHAKDAAALTPQDLQSALSDDAATLPLRPHPAVRIVALNHAVHDVWRFARHPERFPETIDVVDRRQFVIVIRPQFDVATQTVDAGTYALLSALARGQGLDAALRLAFNAAPEFAPEGSLGQLVARGAFASFTPDPED